jgi:KaiC/GvpD/RAD55 family RecA-like ATPase
MDIEGLRVVADIAERPVEWLWDGRVPLGDITILEGDPGTNKSSLCCDLAAALTKGASLPCVSQRGRPRKGGALFLIGEDSIAKTVVPRLQAAGADPQKIGVLEGVAIPGDVDRIEKAIREIDAKLVVVDTISDFVSSCLSSNQAVRKALRPLREVAERTGTAVVMLRHFNKKSSGRTLHRGGGSVGITGTARSQLKLYLHPTDAHMRVLVQDKSNLGPLSPGLVFEVVPNDDNRFRLEWHGETDLTVADLEGSKDGRPKLEAAEKFLLEKLSDGPKDVNWLVKKASGTCSKRTLDEAKKNLQLVTKRTGKGKNHVVSWTFPTAAEPRKRRAKTTTRAKKPAAKKPAVKTPRTKVQKAHLPKPSECDML